MIWKIVPVLVLIIVGIILVYNYKHDTMKTYADYKWHRWFAWYRVEVDAYDASEIYHGHFRRTVWLVMVERRWEKLLPENYENAQDEIPAHWVYRWPRP